MNGNAEPSEQPLYRRDPDAWYAHLAEGNRTQPRKRVAAQVVLHDNAGRVLLVNPSYKPDWDIPGGMVEANESPAEAAYRELSEELGIEVEIRGLLCVDWVSPHGPWDDLLAFVFDAGELTSEQIYFMQPSDGELLGFDFCSYSEAEENLRHYVWNRVNAALKARRAGQTAYLHNGEER